MMKRIDVEFDGQEYTYRTNDSGEYLFTGVGENRQISCESGFDSLSRMKAAIREHLHYHWELDHGPDSTQRPPRIKYMPSQYCGWRD